MRELYGNYCSIGEGDSLPKKRGNYRQIYSRKKESGLSYFPPSGKKKKKLLDCSNFPALKLYIATAAKSNLDGKTCLEKTMFSVSPLEYKAMTLGEGEKGLFEPFPPLFSALLLLLLVFSCKQGMHHHNPLEKEEEGNNNAKGRRTTEGFY